MIVYQLIKIKALQSERYCEWSTSTRGLIRNGWHEEDCRYSENGLYQLITITSQPPASFASLNWWLGKGGKTQQIKSISQWFGGRWFDQRVSEDWGVMLWLCSITEYEWIEKWRWLVRLQQYWVGTSYLFRIAILCDDCENRAGTNWTRGLGSRDDITNNSDTCPVDMVTQLGYVVTLPDNNVVIPNGTGLWSQSVSKLSPFTIVAVKISYRW